MTPPAAGVSGELPQLTQLSQLFGLPAGRGMSDKRAATHGISGTESRDKQQMSRAIIHGQLSWRMITPYLVGIRLDHRLSWYNLMFIIQ